MTTITRRNTLGLAAGAAGAFVLPRISIAQTDQRPSLTLAVQAISNSNTLEPMREQSNVGARIFYPFAETLLDLDWTGNYQMQPRLAASFQRIDERTVELKLRQNVRFHNGDLMTPDDVAFSFGPQRMWSGSALNGVGAYVGNTAGAASKLPPPEVPGIAKASYPSFDRVDIVDAQTVRFINKAPDLAFEGRLTKNSGVIFSHRSFDEAANWLDFARKPAGTGPYRVVDFKPDTSLLLEAFDDYWGGRPPIKSIRFVEVPEVSSRVDGLLAGDYDFAFDLPPDQIEGIEKNPRFHVLGGLINNIRITSFDKNHPQLRDPRIRRAMSHSIDRQAIVDSLWLGRTAVPKGLQWEFYGDMMIRDWDVPKYDPDLAKQLLHDANYQGGEIPYQLLNDYYTNQVATAQVLVEGWRQVGLNVTIEMKENWGQVLDPNPRRGIFDFSNAAAFSDPVASMASFGPGAQLYQTNQWRNDEAQQQLVILQTGSNQDARRAAFRRMLEICEQEDPAYIVLNQNATFTGTRKDYKWKAANSFAVDFRSSNWG